MSARLLTIDEVAARRARAAGVTVERHEVDDPAGWATLVRTLSALLDARRHSGRR